MAKILLIVCRAARAIHTARQTSQLQPMARTKASPNPRLILAEAVFTATAPRAPVFQRPEK